MAQSYLTNLFICLLLLLVVVVPAAVDAKASARLRGKHFDALEEIVRNPEIDAHIRGKTLKDLGIEESNNKDDQSRRKTQLDDDETVTLQYFSVYDEFDNTALAILGETAGSRGMIYNPKAKDTGLVEEYVEGALQGTCSLVSSDGKQLCSYEFFLLNPSTGSLGTVVATGTVKNEVDTNSALIIEATGDDFVGYNGGIVYIKYTAIGEQTVMDITLAMKL